MCECGRGGAVAQADEPDSYDDELARIDASIADLKIRDMAAAKERTQIASKIQAAQFQRDIWRHANKQAKKTKPRRVRRPRSSAGPQAPAASSPPPRAAEGPPDWAAPDTPHTGPPGVATDGRTLLVDDPPPTERPAAPPPRPPAAPPRGRTRLGDAPPPTERPAAPPPRRPAGDHPPVHHPPEAS